MSEKSLLERLRENPLCERRIVSDALKEVVMSPSSGIYMGLAAELYELLFTEFHQIAAEALADIPESKRRNLRVHQRKIAELKEKFGSQSPTGIYLRVAFPD